MVDTNRLVQSLQLKYQDSSGDFAWGHQLDGEILRSIEIKGIVNLQVPFSVEVSFYLCIAITIILNWVNRPCVYAQLYFKIKHMFYTGC